MVARVANRRNGGRIHVHQRETDDTVTTVGADLAMPTNLKTKYNETASLSMTDACRMDYRSRILRIIRWWKENDPGYYEVGVYDVDVEDQNEESKYFFTGKYKQDISYSGINNQFVLHFLVENKQHKKGKRKDKFKSVGDLRKYKDAIMWGAQMQDELLPSKFYTMFDNFLTGYKKEYKKRKKRGK